MDKNITLTKAQNAEIARDFQTAVRLYKELLREDPENLEYLSAIGSNYVKANEDEKALPFYQKIIELFPHSISAMNSMGGIYRRLKRYDESIEILKKALEENKELGTLNYTLGFTYREMGMYDEGIECFDIVVAENPNDVLAYNHLGSIYSAKEEFDKAILSFKKGLQIDQNHPILNYNIAHCYESLGQYPDAIRSYEAALRTRPGWAEAIHDFSDLLLRCDKTKEAQNLVLRSIKLYPNDSRMLCVLGYIFLTQYDFDAAEKTFKKAKKINPEDVSILSGLTEALEKGEKIEEALHTIEEALYIDPENLSLQKQEISTLLSSQEYEQAFKKIDTLYKLNEEDVQLLDLYSQYYACMKDVESTNFYHAKIANLDKNYKKHILSAAKRFSQIGDIDNAEQYAKSYIEKTNNDPEGYNILGKVYSKSGDVDKAIVSYNKGLKLNKDNVYAGKQIAELLKTKIVIEQEEPSPISEHKPEEEKVLENNQLIEEDQEFDFDSLGQNEKVSEIPTSSEDEFWGALGEEFEDSSEADRFELPKKEPEVVGMEELADEESMKSLGDLDPELMEESTGIPIEDDFDFDAFGLEDASEGMEGLAPVENETLENETLENEGDSFFEGENIVQPLEDSQSHVTPEEKIEDLQEKLQESIMNSANLAVETAMNAQKMAQQVADEQSKIVELQKALEDKQAETEQMQEELVMQQIKAEQLQQQILEKQYEEKIKEEESQVESENQEELEQEGLQLVENYDSSIEKELELSPLSEDDFETDVVSENESVETSIETEDEPESEESIEEETEKDDEVLIPTVIETEVASKDYLESEVVEDKINFEGAELEEDLLKLSSDEDLESEVESEAEVEVESENEIALDDEIEIDDVFGMKDETATEQDVESDEDFDNLFDESLESVESLEELDDVEFTPVESEDDEITSQQMFYLVNDNIVPDVEETVEDEKSLDFKDLIFDILIGEYEFPTVDAILADMLLKLSDAEIQMIKQFQEKEEDHIYDDYDTVETEDVTSEENVEESSVEIDEEFSEEADDASNEEIVEEAAEEVAEETNYSELQEMLHKIESVLKDENISETYKSELEMFKKLKLLMDFVPQDFADSINTEKLRVQIEYIISRISGKPGLCKTVSSLIESGYLGDEEMEEYLQEDLTQEQIKSVLVFIKSLAESLDDVVLSKALCNIAEETIQKM